MVSETIVAIAVFGALFGAGLNAVRAWYQAPEAEKFSVKKFIGGIVTGGVAALALINFSTVATSATEGFIALFITNVLLGVGASTLVHQAHKDDKPSEEE